MKRRAMNYVAQALLDIRKGVVAIDEASRRETTDNFILRVKELQQELEVMIEVVTCIQEQQELEV